jgi:hypothetical protein
LISGMSPRAAEIAAQLGVDLGALATFATLEKALQAALGGPRAR